MKSNNTEIIDTQQNKKLEMSLFYYEKLGWSLIPVNKDKTPAIPEWKKYQNERATIDEVKEWFSNPAYYPAVVTGSLSKVAAVDFDVDKQTKQFSSAGIDLMKQLAGTCISISGSGGQHYFYKLTRPLSSHNRVLPGVDIKAEGGYAVLPPALHESGNYYEWDIAPWDEELTEFPYELFPYLMVNNSKKHPIENHDIVLIKEGKRNDELTSIAGTLFKNIAHKPELCKSALLAINEKYCSPPLPESDVLKIVNSVSKYHPNSNEIKKTFTPISVDELFKKEFEADSWLVEGLIPQNGITVISGNPASFKTWLILLLAKHVADGEALFGRFRI